jgi:ABC-type nitrate/sulfonate/bicarbonate transport system permease component
MKTVFVALLGLILGFIFGEALAAIAGFAMFSSTPFGPVLWILRILPVVSAIACAVVAVAVDLRRKSG